MDTFKWKSIVAEFEGESNYERFDDVEYDDGDEGIIGGGVETLVI